MDTANKSHRDILPKPAPNTPVNGILCKIKAGVCFFPVDIHWALSHLKHF
jgi:hypothetical protein